MTDFDPTLTPTGIYKPGKKRDQNLQQILAAAQEEFVQKGFRGASMQAIADRAELPKANVHYYFKRKANLYLSVLNGIIELWNSSFSDISPQDDPAVALDRFIREKVRLAVTHRQASKLFAMEILGGAPYLKDFLETEQRVWVRERAQVIQAWIDAGKMAPVDPMHFIFLIWSSTQHYADFDAQTLAVMQRRDYSGQSIEQISDFLSVTLLRGVGLEAPLIAGSVAAKTRKRPRKSMQTVDQKSTTKPSRKAKSRTSTAN